MSSEQGTQQRAVGTRIRAAISSPVAAQTAIFTVANVLISVLGGLSRAVLAAVMSVASFGAFSFAISFLQFTALIFEFGLFLPAARLAARAEGRERREVLGAGLLVYVPVGLAFAAAIFGLSFFVDDWFKVDAGSALRSVAPLAFVFPFGLVALQLAQGVGRLHVSSLTNLLAQVLFVVGVGVLWLTDVDLGAGLALVLRAAAMAVAAAVLIVWLRPVLGHARRHARQMFADARSYGFQVYVGRVLSVGTFNMDVLILGALTDAKEVALYTLALAAAQAAGLPITGMATALFPRMAREGTLSRRWLALAWGVGLAGIVACWLLADPVFSALFAPVYLGATSFIVPLAMAQAVRGVTTVYNQWLSAQARGRDLRNAGIVLTVTNLVLNFAFIPAWGATGAAWASFLALVANYVAHVVGYRRAVREVQAA